MLNPLFDNPVVTKELRGRMRGTRTYWLLFGYLLVLSLILFFSYLGWSAQHSANMEIGGNEAGFTVGRTFFKTLFYSQAVMMALITPALTAGAISVEREQRTFELLRGSILRPGAIVWGKLLSSVSFVALLLTSSLPLLSLCFLLGGVSPGKVFFAYLLLIGDAFLFGAIGLCWSAFSANTATATVLSYLTLFVFFGVTFPFALPTLDTSGSSPSFGLCAVNPVGAVTGAVLPEHYYGLALPAWLPALLLNGTLTVLLVLAAMNRLEDFPAKRAAALRAVALLFAGLLVFFIDGIVLGAARQAFIPLWMEMEFLLFAAAALLLMFVPVFVTGDLERPQTRGRSPLRLFTSATLPMGLPFALLLTCLVLGLTLMSPHLSPAPTVLVGTPHYGPMQSHLTRTAAAAISAADLTPGIEQGTAMLAAVVVGLAGLGFLLSVLLGNRWSSLTLLYLAVILASALPFFAYGTLHGEDAALAVRNPAVNSLYLCPFYPLIQLSDAIHPSYQGIGYDDAAPGLIGYKSGPLWIGTSAVYLGIGLASYAAAGVILRRRKLTRTA